MGDECSLANSMLVIVTLIAIDAELSRPEPLLWRGGLLPLGCEAAPPLPPLLPDTLAAMTAPLHLAACTSFPPVGGFDYLDNSIQMTRLNHL